MANLLTNPGFEAGSNTGWVAYGATVVDASTNGPRTGTYCGYTGSTDGTQMGAETATASRPAVTAGTIYEVYVWARNGGYDTQCSLEISWYKSNGNLISTTTVLSTTLTGTAVYMRLWGQVTAPALSAKAGIRVTTTTANTFFFDDAFLDVLTVPATPSNLTITVLAGCPQLLIEWTDNATNETDWTLEKNVDSGSSVSYIDYASPDWTSYLDSDVSAGHNYAYRVYCSNLAGASSVSNQPSQTITLTTSSGVASLTGASSLTQ